MTDITATANGPLTGLTVLDLSRALAGPHATMMLGDMGARVIKVESPAGDDTRGWGPPFLDDNGARESTYFLSCNRNKESIVLDLREQADRHTLRRLVRQADVLVENFRPGVLDRLGFAVPTLQELNPRLIILSITGFGHDGPEAGRPGYDQIAQGEAGLMSLTGPDADHPTKAGVPIGDLLAGMYGAFGVLAALQERTVTRRGSIVRTSLLAALIGVHSFQGTRTTLAGQVPRAIGNHHPSIAPYGLFHTLDGPVQVAVGSESLWHRFAPVVGLDVDDPRFASNARRVAHRQELADLIDEALADRAAADVLHELNLAGIPAGKVRTLDEVYAWEQTRSQGLVITVEHPDLGVLELPGSPIRFNDNPYGGGREEAMPPPRLGDHQDTVLDWLDHMEAARADIEPAVRS